MPIAAYYGDMVTQLPSLTFDGDRVKRIRIQLGETQQQFAQRLGVRRQMVDRYECDKSVPRSGPVLKALLQAEKAAAVA